MLDHQSSETTLLQIQLRIFYWFLIGNTITKYSLFAKIITLIFRVFNKIYAHNRKHNLFFQRQCHTKVKYFDTSKNRIIF